MVARWRTMMVTEAAQVLERTRKYDYAVETIWIDLKSVHTKQPSL
jgi:hypothetical protein